MFVYGVYGVIMTEREKEKPRKTKDSEERKHKGKANGRASRVKSILKRARPGRKKDDAKKAEKHEKKEKRHANPAHPHKNPRPRTLKTKRLKVNMFKRVSDKIAGNREKTIVIALGGNALIRRGQHGTMKEQLFNINHAMEQVARLAMRGYQLVITHGNGPQVGNILIQQEEAAASVPKMPLYACVAQSQGLIGYMIQESLYNKLHSIGIHIPVVTMITQALVDRNDKAFAKPTKPIGPYFRDESHLPAHWHVVETLRGARRVVASPDPKGIIETEAIKDLLGKAIVIAAGGGGVPVIRDKIHVSGKKSLAGLYGVEAVVDKDLATAELAKALKADLLVMLTDVDSVYVNWNKPEHRMRIDRMGIEKAEKLLQEGQFHSGNMGPKIEASIRFLKAGGKKVLITEIDKLGSALRGKGGTVIEP